MAQKSSKRRGTFATKIILVVIIAVVLTNGISLVFILENSKTQIRKSTTDTMIDMVNASSRIVMNSIKEQGVEDLSYEQYADCLEGTSLEDMDSSYVYVVKNDGTMLYHPNKDKVGQPVENMVVKGVVEQIQSGNIPPAAVAEYDFNGVTKFSAYSVLENQNIIVITADESEALSGIGAITAGAVGIVVVIEIFAIICSFIIGIRLMKPLVKLSAIIEEVANGDIDADFSGVKESNDEVGLIVIKMKELTNSLGGIVGKIKQSSDSMNVNSKELNTTSNQTLAANDEISKAVEEVAEGSTGMATSIMAINDNLGEMSSETQVIDSSVSDIKKQTATVQDSSRNMNEKMRKMQNSSQNMDEGISTIAMRIQKVNEIVDQVGNIISVIEGISGETNLLSLNASIEAARAGEAGKGFAVVAQEIRVLSDNTNEELGNIRQIITTLVEECQYCVQASNTIVEDNAKQKEEIEAVLSEFDILDEQIQKTAEKANDIQNLVSEMVKLNNQITTSSNSLTDVSAANAAATEEMTANIQELNAMMHGVSEMAGQMDSQSTDLKDALSYFHNR